MQLNPEENADAAQLEDALLECTQDSDEERLAFRQVRMELADASGSFTRL
jgi:hypothetical protein